MRVVRVVMFLFGAGYVDNARGMREAEVGFWASDLGGWVGGG